VAFAISFPPLIGWRTEKCPGECQVSNKKGYVLYSATGSFFLPVTIILAVYLRIFVISRHPSFFSMNACHTKLLFLLGDVQNVGRYPKIENCVRYNSEHVTTTIFPKHRLLNGSKGFLDGVAQTMTTTRDIVGQVVCEGTPTWTESKWKLEPKIV